MTPPASSAAPRYASACRPIALGTLAAVSTMDRALSGASSAARMTWAMVMTSREDARRASAEMPRSALAAVVSPS
ncbi:hypothetical protein ACFFX0_25235 [Citricoccus parietis]|uniref:Uncharacterized protein n=1 Tax=Citricoccus parietis TaxID=592307 RepID=A0ABV5G5X7_9MICC